MNGVNLIVMKNDQITIEIKSNSKKCEQLRNDGLFFKAIANALDLKRKDIKEINTKEKHYKS